MALPATMTCIELPRFGGPEVLIPATRPLPAPGRGEVLVKIAAAGVNRPDLMQRAGYYPPPPGASDIPGLELAGTVVALGDDVASLSEGDFVCALVSGGGYAEYAIAAAPLCLPIPKGLTLVQAAAIPETFFTVWHNMFMRGRLQPGECVLIHGGTSGIGSAAIQLAKAHGAHVFATARGPAKVAACTRLGADRAIDYAAEDFVAVIAKETGGRGVDVVIDIVGGDYFARNIDCLAVEGRHVSVSTLQGYKCEINLRTVMTRRLTLTGSTLRPRPVADKATIAAGLRETVWPWIEAGKVAPVIHATFPLREARAAHALMEEGSHIGKVVLTV